jgi:Holliday junction resolvase RusA-like endonuclease
MQYFTFKPIDKPVRITFTWQEENKRRDLDNVAFAKKFILDAMVKGGYLKDDNRRWVTGFTDEFVYGDRARVTLFIEEAEQ